MEGVIPNSKVVIIPPLEGDSPWRKELYLRPGEWIPWVTLSVVIATVVLAIIVFILHLNEKVSQLACIAFRSLTDFFSARMSWKDDEYRIILILMLCDACSPGRMALYC